MNSFLQDATPVQLEQAAADNHRQLFCLNAITHGGEVVERPGISWTFGGVDRDAMVAFPGLEEENAGATLDEMLSYYQKNTPSGVGCWSLSPMRPADIGVRLLARGFQPGWRPCWMALDLEEIRLEHCRPVTLEMLADNAIALDKVRNLPNAGVNSALSVELLRDRPELTQQFVAKYRKRIAGHSAVLLGTGDNAVAGVYNVGVVPWWRDRGIGKALVIAACLHAKARGYRYITLNATGRRMYEQIGFKWISDGYTWWMKGDKLLIQPPSPALIALTEAVGRGDMDELEASGRQFPVEILNRPLRNGMTLMQLAIHCGQPASAEWLRAQGVSFSVLDAWDLGWKDLAEDMLKAHPAAVNQQYGEWGTTLLHIAADRNDTALARLALSVKPDLGIRDRIYLGTALGWAQHLEKPEIVRLISEYERGN